jgi:Mlc titration factor MtfA (ptsG expression regulator)
MERELTLFDQVFISLITLMLASAAFIILREIYLVFFTDRHISKTTSGQLYAKLPPPIIRPRSPLRPDPYQNTITISKEYIFQQGAQFLEGNFPFFQRLQSDRKKRFLIRVHHFILSKRFETRKVGFELTKEMVILISATAIQVMMGLPKVYLQNFHTILIYPDDYYSTINRQYHQGEVNPKLGILIISWRSFLLGIKNSKDGINLGLHEMAHALHLENTIRNNEFNFLSKGVLKVWDKTVRKRFQQKSKGTFSIFRDYAYTNHHEFFAVAIENFFERPKWLSEKDPAIFNLLTVLLNQHPR